MYVLPGLGGHVHGVRDSPLPLQEPNSVTYVEQSSQRVPTTVLLGVMAVGALNDSAG